MLIISAELMRLSIIFKKQVRCITTCDLPDITKVALIKGLSMLSRRRFLSIWNPIRYTWEYESEDKWHR